MTTPVPADAGGFFETSFAPHVDALYRTALRMAGRREDAEDLVQETALRAFRAIRQFEPGTNFRAWLFRILTNTFINRYRKQSREPALVDFADAESLAVDAARDAAELTPADAERLREQLGDEVRQAIDRLAPEFRTVLHLAVFEGFAYKEIAGITGVPIGTVMSRLFRARRMLKEELTQYARERGILKA